MGGEGTRSRRDVSGQIDASLEQYPRTGELEAKGFRVLVDCLQIAADYPNTSYVSTRAFIQKNPEIVKQFLMGISEGIHECKNKDEGMRLTAREFLRRSRQSRPPRRLCHHKVYPDIPRPSLKGIALVLDEMKTPCPRRRL